ncbi:MAG: hypothetical protein SGPRY_004441 [Prymnesium sp.]
MDFSICSLALSPAVLTVPRRSLTPAQTSPLSPPLTLDCPTLQELARPYCSLEHARQLFETHATKRSSQVWGLTFHSFARLFEGSARPDALRDIFNHSCRAKSDVGTGWDPLPEGQMSFFAFTEALLSLSLGQATTPEQGLADAVNVLVERARQRVALTSTPAENREGSSRCCRPQCGASRPSASQQPARRRASQEKIPMTHAAVSENARTLHRHSIA